jgi:RimJ/RimL family protein N-acetyltransferase
MANKARIELRTKRCVLQPVEADDAKPLHELWSSAGVRRFLWDDEIIPMARTVEAIEQERSLLAFRFFI